MQPDKRGLERGGHFCTAQACWHCPGRSLPSHATLCSGILNAVQEAAFVVPAWKTGHTPTIYIGLEHSDVSGTIQGMEVQSPVLHFPLLQCPPPERPLSAQLRKVHVLSFCLMSEDIEAPASKVTGLLSVRTGAKMHPDSFQSPATGLFCSYHPFLLAKIVH